MSVQKIYVSSTSYRKRAERHTLSGEPGKDTTSSSSMTMGNEELTPSIEICTDSTVPKSKKSLLDEKKTHEALPLLRMRILPRRGCGICDWSGGQSSSPVQ